MDTTNQKVNYIMKIKDILLDIIMNTKNQKVNYIAKIKDILLNILPIVLNNIVIEYMVNVHHEFKIIKRESNACHAKSYCISNNKIYTHTFSYNFNKLVSTLLNNNLHYYLYASKLICAYKNNIYVVHKDLINIFDEKCNKIRTINIHCKNSQVINIVNDKIIIGCYCNYNKQINIIDLHNLHIEYINLPKSLYTIKTYNDTIYFLTYGEIIYKYIFGNDIEEVINYNDKYNFDIFDFCIIDSTLYISIKCNNNSMPNGIYECCENNVVKNNITTDEVFVKIEVVNNIFIAKTSRDVTFTYYITIKNIFK